MTRVGAVAATVYRDPFHIATALVAAAVSVVVLAWAGQVVTRFDVGGLYWDLEPGRIVLILALGVSYGLAVPLVVESWRQARRAGRRRAAGGRSGLSLLAGGLGGIACLSCCSPLLLPAVAGFLGAGGTALLSANLTLHRWFLLLALVSLAIVNGSSALILRDLVRGCRVAAPRG